MQFATLVLAAAALATGISAKPILTATEYATITVGESFTIGWANATAAVTITLQDGPQTDLKDFIVLGSDLPFPSGSIEWKPDTDLPNQQYALKISDGTGDAHTNYAGPFQVIGATAAVSSASTAVSTASVSVSTGSSSVTSDAASTTVESSSAPTSTSADSSSTGSSSVASKTSTNTASKTSPSVLPTTSVPGSASNLASPFAMVLLGFAAILAIN